MGVKAKPQTDKAPSVNHIAPPNFLDVLFHLHSKRAIIIETIETVVDLRGLEHEAPSLADRHDVFHGKLEVWIQNDTLLLLLFSCDHLGLPIPVMRPCVCKLYQKKASHRRCN